MKTIVSPCVNICQLDAKSDVCLGCGRTRAEIGAWLVMSLDERAAVMARLAHKKPAPVNN